VAHDTLLKAGCVVWCGAVGYAFGLRDVARATSLNPQICVINLKVPYFSEQNVFWGMVCVCARVCVRVHGKCVFIMYFKALRNVKVLALSQPPR